MGTYGDGIDERLKPFMFFMMALANLGLKSPDIALKQSIYTIEGKCHTKDEFGNFYPTILLGEGHGA